MLITSSDTSFPLQRVVETTLRKVLIAMPTGGPQAYRIGSIPPFWWKSSCFQEPRTTTKNQVNWKDAPCPSTFPRNRPQKAPLDAGPG